MKEQKARMKTETRDFVSVILGVLLLIIIISVISAFIQIFATTNSDNYIARLLYNSTVIATFVFIGYFVVLDISYYVRGVDLEGKYRVIRWVNKVLRLNKVLSSTEEKAKVKLLKVKKSA